MFQLHASETNGSFIKNSWLDTIHGLEIDFDSYVKHLAPRDTG
ncbi:MAG TPA: hypothetical protein VIS94_13265 [Desulfomonilia bacterium]